MRLLLSVLMAIALAVLPLGGMTGSAHAAAAGGAAPCHHVASGSTAAEIGSPAVHEHGHAHYSADESEFDFAIASVMPGAGHTGKPFCPHCGVGCHCLASCASACGGLAVDNIVLVPSLDAVGGMVAPGRAAVLRSWTMRPWPPPPRA